MSNEEALHPGDKIRYWPGFREGGSSVGEVISERTVLGGHTTGYFIRKSNGGTDFIAETHIASSPSRPAPRDAKSARDVIADEVKPPIHEPVATEVALAAADRLLAALSAAGYVITRAEDRCAWDSGKHGCIVAAMDAEAEDMILAPEPRTGTSGSAVTIIKTFDANGQEIDAAGAGSA